MNRRNLLKGLCGLPLAALGVGKSFTDDRIRRNTRLIMGKAKRESNLLILKPKELALLSPIEGGRYKLLYKSTESKTKGGVDLIRDVVVHNLWGDVGEIGVRVGNDIAWLDNIVRLLGGFRYCQKRKSPSYWIHRRGQINGKSVKRRYSSLSQEESVVWETFDKLHGRIHWRGDDMVIQGVILSTETKRNT